MFDFPVALDPDACELFTLVLLSAALKPSLFVMRV